MLHNISSISPRLVEGLMVNDNERRAFEYRVLEEPEQVTELDPEEDSEVHTASEHEHEPHSDHVNDTSATELQRDDEDFGEGDTIQAPDSWKKNNNRSKRKKYVRTGRRKSFVMLEGFPEGAPVHPTRQRSKSVCAPLPKIIEAEKRDEKDEREEEEKKEPKKENLNCLVAKSALIIPFSFGSHRTPPGILQQKLLDRQIIGPTGELINVWELNDSFPMEVAELSRQFHQMIGWREKKAGKNAWRCRRFRLTKDAYNILFNNPRLWALQREDGKDRDIYRDVIIDNVDLDLFPLGTGIIIFHINWLAPCTNEHHNDSDEEGGSATEEDEEEMRARYRKFHETASQMGNNEHIASLSLEDLRTWLYVAKFRHSIPHVSKGWTFRSDSERAPCVAHIDSLGRRMHRAIYESRPISLNSVGNWLLMFAGENPSTPPSRVAYGGHAYHHSIVVLDSEPSPDTLQEYLFHLRHAYGQKNKPPPLTAQMLNMGGTMGSLDRVLIPRLNRYIGISREGIVCMTWSTEYAGTSLDVSTWHKKFQGIYLVLSLHAHGERTVLEELSTLAANYADNMQLDLEKASIQEIEVSRRQMKELATLVARFTISMSSDDCGGQSEYSEFFSTIRQTFGIPHQRAELREELQDTFSLLESGFLEERRRIKMEEQKEERAEKERTRKSTVAKEAGKHRYETIISTISSVTIPAVLISSIFGMNVNVPDLEFWVVILIMVGMSIAALIMQLSYLRTIERHHQHEY